MLTVESSRSSLVRNIGTHDGNEHPETRQQPITVIPNWNNEALDFFRGIIIATLVVIVEDIRHMCVLDFA